MAQIAKTGAAKAPAPAQGTTDNLAELRKRIAQQSADVARDTTDRTEDMARRGAAVMQQTVDAVAEVERAVADRSAEGMTPLGRAFLELANEQTQHNLETLQALSGAVDWTRFAKVVDWGQVFQIQRAYLRASLERTTRLTQRYLEAGQAATTSAAAAQRQAPKAA
jgi:hypothetical protein